jgi:hypothetical protein
MREISDKSVLDRFAIDFAGIVEKHCKYIIVSGFVAISSGRTRGTEDIDMIIPKLKADEFLRLHKNLLKGGFVCLQSDDEKVIYSYLSDLTSVRYSRKDSPLPEMELKFAKDPLDDYQLGTRTKLKLTGLNLWFSNVNVNIAFKEKLLKSPKDLEDSRHLRIVYSELIDEKEIKKVEDMIERYRL